MKELDINALLAQYAELDENYEEVIPDTCVNCKRCGYNYNGCTLTHVFCKVNLTEPNKIKLATDCGWFKCK